MTRSAARTATAAMLTALLAGAGCGLAPTPQSLTLGDGPGALATGYKPYYGIQHTHVAENGDDGQGTLAEAYAYARDKAKLDFLGVSSHSHMITDAGYAAMKKAAREHTRDGRFVAILAQEWSSISKGGHINIFEADVRCPLENGAWDEFYGRWLPDHPEVGWVQFNHPHPSNPREFGGLGFSPVARAKASVVAIDKIAGMALLNGPGKYPKADERGTPDDWDRGANGQNYEEEWKAFLNRGWRVGAAGDQDNHVPNWGLACQTRTGVWARSLSRAGLLEAFRSRRTFATSDHDLALWFTVNGQPMGSEIAGGKPLEVVVTADDPDTTIDRLELYGDTDGPGGRPAQLVEKTAVGAKKASWKLKLAAPSGDAYYFAKVCYKNAWAWASPVWVEAAPVSRRK